MESRQSLFYKKNRDKLLEKKREKYRVKHPWKGDEVGKNIPIKRDPIEVMLDKMNRERGY